MRVEETGLQCTLCVPGTHAPKSMKIIARVFDGIETVEYQFGPHMPLSWIWRQIPRIYMDSHFPPRKKVKGIINGDVIDIEKDGKKVNAVMFTDGCIRVSEKEAV